MGSPADTIRTLSGFPVLNVRELRLRTVLGCGVSFCRACNLSYSR